MIVVSNTSPIHYLILIEQINLLSQLFKKIIIPEAVYRELSDKAAPPSVQSWILHSPNWLEIQAVREAGDEILDLLDPGERAAILLAQALKADLLLLDDMKARRAAKDKSFAVAGTLGILDQAATMKLINLPVVVRKLQSTSFWVSETLIQKLLDKHS